jgi:hypothetical protein
MPWILEFMKEMEEMDEMDEMEEMEEKPCVHLGSDNNQNEVTAMRGIQGR